MKAPKLKFIYWFAYYNLDSPSVRYRGHYPLDYLRQHYGIKSYFIIPGYKPSRILLFLQAYFSALLFRKKDSLIVVQRVNSIRIYANLIKLLIKFRNTNTIYDIDDADYLEYPPKTIYYFIRNCSAVSVGSNELVKNLQTINANILLNTSPTPDLGIVKKNRNSIPVLGWIGGFGGGHKESLLKSFFPALKDLPFKIKLVLLGVVKKGEYEFLTTYFKSFENIILDIPQGIDWKDEKAIQERITAFDIGVATLLDDEPHRSKSAFKTKQYLNNGVPVISSDIPENNLFVLHGHNGFLCSTPENFRQRIIEIKEMSDERYALLSKAARESIPKFTLKKYCDHLCSHFENQQ